MSTTQRQSVAGNGKGRNHGVRPGPLLFVVLSSAVIFTAMVHDMVSPEMSLRMDPEGLSYVYVPDDDQFVEVPHRLEVNAWGEGEISESGSASGGIPPSRPSRSEGRADRIRVEARYWKSGSDDVRRAPFQQVAIEGGRHPCYFLHLPPLERGERYFYTIEVSMGEGEGASRHLLQHQNGLFERLASGTEERPFWVTYEGRGVDRWLLAAHIVLTLGAIFFLFHGLYYVLAWLQTRGTSELRKAWHVTLWGWAAFTTSAIPIGCHIAKITFGVAWGAWPIGTDITDTKSQFIILFWAAILVLRAQRRGVGEARRPLLSDVAFVMAVLLGMAATTVIFLIPHSVFI